MPPAIKSRPDPDDVGLALRRLWMLPPFLRHPVTAISSQSHAE
jgi:hypothetical protein